MMRMQARMAMFAFLDIGNRVLKTSPDSGGMTK